MPNPNNDVTQLKMKAARERLAKAMAGRNKNKANSAMPPGKGGLTPARPAGPYITPQDQLRPGGALNRPGQERKGKPVNAPPNAPSSANPFTPVAVSPIVLRAGDKPNQGIIAKK